MEIKYNEATHNRPGGDRMLDAPFILSDLNRYIVQLKEEETWTKSNRNSITIFKTDGFTMLLTCLRKNSSIEKNVLDGLLTLQVIEGSIEVLIDSKITLTQNQLISIHAGIEHTISATEDSAFLMINRNNS